MWVIASGGLFQNRPSRLGIGDTLPILSVVLKGTNQFFIPTSQGSPHCELMQLLNQQLADHECGGFPVRSQGSMQTQPCFQGPLGTLRPLRGAPSQTPTVIQWRG